MTIAWDTLLVPQRCSPEPLNIAASGGRSAGGREQRTLSDAGFWQVAVSGIRIATRQQAAAYRAMIARLRMGEDIILPIFEKYKPLGAWADASSATLVGATALRATQITLSVSGIAVQAGHYFSMADRLYLVTAIVAGPPAPPFENPVATDSPWFDEQPWADPASTAANYTIRIFPPLRADLPDATPASFKALAVRCVIKDLANGNLELNVARFGSPSLTFVESL